MGRIKNTLKQVRFIQSVLNIRNGVKDICLNYISLRGFEKYGYREKSSTVYMPVSISNPQNVYLHEYTRIQPGAKIINNIREIHFEKIFRLWRRLDRTH